MKKQLTRILVLAGVFVVSFIIFSLTSYKDQETSTTEMAEASIPVIYFYNGDQKINETHGYTSEMDTAEVRGSILPVAEDGVIHLEADLYHFGLDEISYRVLDRTGSEITGPAEIGSYQQENQIADITFELAADLETDTEYMLEMTLVSGQQKVRYYTRLIRPETDETSVYITMAEDFHDHTFEEDSTYFDDYVEATSGDLTTLNYVDLHCGYSQIAWGSLEVTQVGDCTVDVWEITPHYSVLTLSYRVSAPDAEGNTAEYDVREYYRLKQGSKRVIVLNFERTMNQIFTFDTADIGDDGTINLGIRDTAVEYKAAETGTLAAFVQDGDLWSYDASSGNLTCIFSFRGADADVRNDYNQHDIQVLQVSDGGNVDYIVSGYMNRGPHEGQVGILLMHYDGFVHLNEEQAFIPVDTSAQILMSRLQDAVYQDENSNTYLRLGQSLYKISISDQKAELVLDNLTSACSCVSDNGRYIAWVDSDSVYSSDTITVMDLAGQKENTLQAVLNYYIRPLAFIDTDLVYGNARQEDVGTDGSGSLRYPMESLRIVDASTDNLEEMKTFRKNNQYVMSVEAVNGSLQLGLSSLQDNVYVTSGVDAVMDKEYDDGKVLSTTLGTETDRETIVKLKVNQSSDEIKVRQMKVQEVLQDTYSSIELPEDTSSEDTYYVYSQGQVKLCTDNYCEAVLAANECKGVVLDQNQDYVWKRDRKSEVSAFADMGINASDGMQDSVTMSVSAVLRSEGIHTSALELLSQGMSVTEILEDQIGCRAFELEGVGYDEILSYISQGTPVIAMTGPDTAIVICGYNSETISYYNPITNTTSRVLYATMKKMLKDGEGRFYVYFK